MFGIDWAATVEPDETQFIERYGSLAPESRIWFIDDEGLGAAHPLPDKALWQLLSADKYAVRAMAPYLGECGMQVEPATGS